MNISNYNTILYNGDAIQRILYRGLPCYNLMTMRIMYADDGSYCVSVNFNSNNCTTWETLVNMYPDVFTSAYSTVEGRYMININSQLLKTAPSGYHYCLKNGNGEDVFIDDEIVFDSSNHTTYILHLESSGGSVSGGSSD